jgi:hypothetical protein
MTRRYGLFLLVSILLLSAGCSVGWQKLRRKGNAEPSAAVTWKCPEKIELHYSGGTMTRSRGPKKLDAATSRRKEDEYRRSTSETLEKFGCVAAGVQGIQSGETLEIEIEEMQSLSASEWEYLTGLSLGLIPSLSTRTAELQFKFKQGARNEKFEVDEVRFNHLAVTPFFWLSFFLENDQSRYREALAKFVRGI